MKKSSKVFGLVLGATLLLTGCDASFSITSSDLEGYAESNSGAYSDVTSQYESYGYVEGVYVMEANDVHVELWDFDTSGNASGWFNNNLESTKQGASSSSGSSTGSSGNYTINKGGTCYRLLFCDDLGIWAEGTSKDEINEVLSDLGILE